VAKDHSTDVTGTRTAKVGKDDNLKVEKKLVIEAGEEITIKTGDASIVMNKNGSITIKGKDIVIDGSGKVTAKASGDMVLKGSKIAAN
jgi:type VI secretion system secreted protein VgrG